MKSTSVYRDCAFLSDGTLATLTGEARYQELDRIRGDFLMFVEREERARTFRNWMDAWTDFYGIPGSPGVQERAA